ncbi:MAG: ATP-binding cassette domain-containing protein [Candidatus Azobacteroides sp.]|nr:ATP-binding cassette domain-containing protein [Candidatus Azobacteroides sp.]
MIHIHVERKLMSADGVKILTIETRIPENQLICITGHSGAGKTTMLRMIAGLTRPDKGIIQIGETTVFDSFQKINLPPQKRNIGFMFQDYALFPNMTVEENIAFAQSREKDKDWINMLMETFGLKALRKQKPDKLSGGQKQRVALARALARKANILLLDEPLSAVDRKMRTELQDEILKTHQLFGSTILLVSHDEDEINKMASYIFPMDGEKSELKKV